MKTILQIIEDMIARHPEEIRTEFSKKDFMRWLEAAGHNGAMCANLFSEFRGLAEREFPRFSLGTGEVIYLASFGVKKGRRYSIQDGRAMVEPVSFPRSEKRNPVASSSVFLSTAPAVDKFLSEFDLTIGGDLIGPASLKILRTPDDLDVIPNQQMGCYFIFSTLTEEQVPNLSADDYRCFERSIEKDGLTFRCLYNGKGANTRERLMVHLFNKSTRAKALNSADGRIKISSTGAMSLDVIDREDIRTLETRSQLGRSKHLLKKVKKSLQVPSNVQHDPEGYFVNGIDIREEKWSGVSWAVCTIVTDSEFGKILIEEAFARKNGRPPLCRRHG